MTLISEMGLSRRLSSQQAVPSTIHQRRNEEVSSTEKEKGLAGAILDE